MLCTGAMEVADVRLVDLVALEVSAKRPEIIVGFVIVARIIEDITASLIIFAHTG